MKRIKFQPILLMMVTSSGIYYGCSTEVNNKMNNQEPGSSSSYNYKKKNYDDDVTHFSSSNKKLRFHDKIIECISDFAYQDKLLQKSMIKEYFEFVESKITSGKPSKETITSQKKFHREIMTFLSEEEEKYDNALSTLRAITTDNTPLENKFIEYAMHICNIGEVLVTDAVMQIHYYGRHLKEILNKMKFIQSNLSSNRNTTDTEEDFYNLLSESVDKMDKIQDIFKNLKVLSDAFNNLVEAFNDSLNEENGSAKASLSFFKKSLNKYRSDLEKEIGELRSHSSYIYYLRNNQPFQVHQKYSNIVPSFTEINNIVKGITDFRARFKEAEKRLFKTETDIFINCGNKFIEYLEQGNERMIRVTRFSADKTRRARESFFILQE
ncbi:hypothetical protein [Candidatus Cardinium hertigii]|jgi:CRISPR/Cas system CSM-associated protein Csm2 small subunit|uniref:Uncharacterized protein n=1 Tax=Candidatus Cardinium hertigii TaxID=247481 RepID=A0A3N2QDG3_9BACT|nr:hypothetical protein [Candidatus Cardinium hertigii]ROT47837.1 hypothetical protein EDM02_00160 [Candidatus Cardinium hertigii]